MNVVDSSSAETTKHTVEVEIERLLPGGVGLAHAEGMTLFVALAAPGDVVRAQIDRVQGNVGYASIVEVVKPSPERVEPPCPYFGLCGGCDFQQLNYPAQLRAKAEIIRDCLHRIALPDHSCLADAHAGLDRQVPLQPRRHNGRASPQAGAGRRRRVENRLFRTRVAASMRRRVLRGSDTGTTECA